ncbi:hypothetical protein SAMN02745857_03049 [Andreprevotia lacus DSM 23236]|uniref:Uncharacterized protein n=1 Tax=Andreprevotia lacus DSM 23236 TaxID=1121001 RepID=A0A1W1XVS2_9NEIS|nr:hypothetical protein [Andreprevotia lacus]SMC27952.1 hypothetical protein SAMN02745857_03049 [Andreprevotia lacus DSM 23236]
MLRCLTAVLLVATLHLPQLAVAAPDGAANGVEVVAVPALDIQIPVQLGAMHFVEREQFEEAGMGESLSFAGPARVHVNVYVYDDGFNNIPDGTQNAAVREQFATVIEQARQALKQYADAARFPNSTQTSHFAGCGPQFLWQQFEFDLKGQHNTSYTYLTGLHGQFVKLRISHPAQESEAPRQVEVFLQQLRKALGRCAA